MPDEQRASLADLARLFLKLGTTAFGGPAAHIAMMEDEVVRRRGWLTREAFLDYLGATNLIPGPNSTELAIHVGQAQAGWRGLVVAGASFILPACLIVTALAWAYVRYQRVPAAAGILYGVKPVVIVVMAQALWRLGHTAVKTRTLAILGALAAAAAAWGVNELLLLALAGVLSALAVSGSRRTAMGAFAALTAPASAAGAAVPFAMSTLFLTFLKIGAVLFGSGYVLLAFVRADFVERLGWLTNQQILDAVAVGQVTPGPVFTTATFIGYVLGGARGAVVATAGIFLPAFVFVAVSGPLVPRIRRSRAAGAFLDGVNVASLALMLVVTVALGRAAVVDRVTLGLAVAAGVALFGFRVNSAWLIGVAAVVGLLAR
jgi:chromate transporter